MSYAPLTFQKMTATIAIGLACVVASAGADPARTEFPQSGTQPIVIQNNPNEPGPLPGSVSYLWTVYVRTWHPTSGAPGSTVSCVTTAQPVVPNPILTNHLVVTGGSIPSMRMYNVKPDIDQGFADVRISTTAGVPANTTAQIRLTTVVKITNSAGTVYTQTLSKVINLTFHRVPVVGGDGAGESRCPDFDPVYVEPLTPVQQSGTQPIVIRQPGEGGGAKAMVPVSAKSSLTWKLNADVLMAALDPGDHLEFVAEQSGAPVDERGEPRLSLTPSRVGRVSIRHKKGNRYGSSQVSVEIKAKKGKTALDRAVTLTGSFIIVASDGTEKARQSVTKYVPMSFQKR